MQAELQEYGESSNDICTFLQSHFDFLGDEAINEFVTLDEIEQIITCSTFWDKMPPCDKLGGVKVYLSKCIKRFDILSSRYNKTKQIQGKRYHRILTRIRHKDTEIDDDTYSQSNNCDTNSQNIENIDNELSNHNNNKSSHNIISIDNELKNHISNNSCQNIANIGNELNNHGQYYHFENDTLNMVNMYNQSNNHNSCNDSNDSSINNENIKNNTLIISENMQNNIQSLSQLSVHETIEISK